MWNGLPEWINGITKLKLGYAPVTPRRTIHALKNERVHRLSRRFSSAKRMQTAASSTELER
jgi:hypothetical protein